MTKIVLGPASVELGKNLANILGAEAIQVETKRFPDGESYLRIDGDLEGDDVIIVQSTFPPPDKHLVQLIQLLDTARDLNASKLTAVIPYLAYSRQDKRFRPGESITMKTVIKMIESAGANSLITIDIHNEKILDYFAIEANNLSAMSAIGRYFSKEVALTKPYVFAPDQGALTLAKVLASHVKADYSFFQKQRDRKTGDIETLEKSFDVQGRDAIVVDDIISTGSTIANASKILKNKAPNTFM